MNDLRIATARTWAEINLDNLEHNIKTLRKLLNPDAKFLGVCKADAYGHGMTECAKKLQACGADWIAVASVTEGAELRRNGITLPILCLGQANPDLAPLMCEYDITQAVGDLENGRALSDYAGSVGKKIKIHVKIDTGMSRTGFYWPDTNKESVAREIKNLCELPGLEHEGMFTHFAAADDDENFTRLQLKKFLEAKEFLLRLGLSFKLIHAAASVGILNYPEAHLNMGRFGLVLYGYESTDTGNEGSTLGLQPVMKVKSKITAVRKLPAGTTISYGRTFTLKRDSLVAVLPIGYADGLPRVLSNNFSVKIHDVLCPILGRICMDMTMADVTDLEGVKAGDVAVIFDGDLIPLAAKNSGTIIHEIVCSPSPRVPRVFIENGELRE
ncbi:MAG: alanine racemase [Synergistales bacterium]|nr:alanine racemase [Synergistales bacterium]MDY6405102.1 alanine racemase [Synergistales bacterium]MDY6410790.1 alanine racemase [Synergistales bacterium]MDY6414057.1 alanine racemase [Synergistales bacterium]MDY6423046.1 alanine racemase [Synergistales bacterium]